MSALLIAQIATVVLVVGGGTLVLMASHRFRRHRKILERIGEKHSLTIAPRPLRSSLSTKAGRFEGQDAEAKLDHVMVGRGESKGVILADREIAGQKHSVLYFELDRAAHLDGFFVRPEAGDELQLRWRAPRSTWNDQRALSMGARVMFNLATVGDREGATPIGLEVQDDRVWIHTRERLRGDVLDAFAGDAMRLRTMLMRSLERANAPRTSNSGTQRPKTSLPTIAEVGDTVTVLRG